MSQFSQTTCEALNYYVYCLVDPISNMIFYIWKGKNNRVFEHVKCALKEPTESDKLNQIRNINGSGHQVRHYIIRHNLTEIESLKVEASLIDILNFKDFNFELWADLKNISSGHFKLESIQKTEYIESLYCAKDLDLNTIKHNLLIININKTYKTSDSVYEATRKWWVINEEKANKVDYVLSEYKGVIRAIFKPSKSWIRSPFHKNRRGFEWDEVLDKNICDLYLNKWYKRDRWAAMPIRYLYPEIE